MFEAQIVGTEDASGYGNYKFDHLPSHGDRIVIGNNRGSLDTLRVLWVEHHPVKIPASEYARHDPHVLICVEYIDSDDE